MKRIKPIVLWLGALIAIALTLLIVEADLLWKTQQYDIFLFTPLFFKQQMVVAGGMLSYLGSFFTQFFYYPWMGVVILCGWWLLLMWLVKHTFCIPDRWNILALIPIAILLVANMQLGYWVYYLNLPGYFFVATIGTTAATALLWVFRKLPDRLWIRGTFIVVVVLAGYPLMGTYALAAALLMGVLLWRLSSNRTQNVVLSMVALLAIVAAPLFYYRYVYHQTNLLYIYQAALPDFSIEKTYPIFKIPYFMLAACFLVLAVTFRRVWPEKENVREAKIKKTPKDKNVKSEAKGKRPVLRWTVQSALLAMLVVGVWFFWYKDANFHHELKMQRCIEKADWEGVIEEGQKQDNEPTRSIVMMHNLALSRLGRQCAEMYSFPKGSKRSNTPLPVFMCTVAGKMIYYQYGVMNECHRLCMEDGVQRTWNVELLQYMTRTALLSKETQTVRKFTDLLRKTLFYGDWADHMEKMADFPDLVAQDSETGPITHMMHYDDIQSEGDSYVERNLMSLLARQDADDPYMQEQAVLGAMWTRDSQYFWPRFEKYVNNMSGNNVPRIFQEAAFLFGMLEHQDFIKQLPFDKSVVTSFQGFMNVMEQYKSSPSQARNYLYSTYGNTYYFEYFFLKDITYY